jgi:hypothetical protein
MNNSSIFNPAISHPASINLTSCNNNHYYNNKLIFILFIILITFLIIHNICK